MTETDERRSRLARRVFPEGTEPDPRFTLANERTFLAWMRTALAFVAGGVAVEAFTNDFMPEVWRRVVAVLVVLTGLVISVMAGARWLSVERSMRTGRPLPVPLLVPLLCGTGAVASIVTVLMIATLNR